MMAYLLLTSEERGIMSRYNLTPLLICKKMKVVNENSLHQNLFPFLDLSGRCFNLSRG